MAKWFERGIKKQKTQFFCRDTPLSQLFANPLNQTSQETRNYPSPLGSPPEVGNVLSKERDSWVSNSSEFFSAAQEPSVEEPNRYGTRLYEFAESILQ